MKTREQIYAAKIYEHVEGIKIESENLKEQLRRDEDNRQLKKQYKKSLDDNADYKNTAKNLPVLIRSAGLVQALYFAKTRNAGSEKLIEHLADAIGNRGLLADSRTETINEYIHLTEKCLLALKWYKRFVDIHIEDQNGEN